MQLKITNHTSNITSLIGFASSLLGVGGGSLLVPLFLRNKLSIHQSIATSSACGLLVAFVGTVAPFLFNFIKPTLGASYVHWPAVFWFVLGSIPAAPLGTEVAHYLSGEILKIIFFAVIIIVYITVILF